MSAYADCPRCGTAGFSIGVNLGHEHADDSPRCTKGAGP